MKINTNNSKITDDTIIPENKENINSDEEFLISYVGNSYDSFKTNKFNFGAFFFGSLYFAYRKMWKELGIILGISLFIRIFTNSFETITPEGTIYLPLILNSAILILFAFNTNKLYLKHAKKQVEIIKQENQDKSNQEIHTICRNKGKVTILVPYLILVVTLLLAYLATI